MAHSKQARKRIKQNEKNRLANKAKMTAMKNGLKALFAAVAAGDKPAATLLLARTCKIIDKAAKKDVIHDNNAARQKSRAMRVVAAMK
ncbi:MAG TPA: 30S ribosomal protein S20 [Planctomycetota bacterium]|nr:30S ribosomal protein S20 [Planctomycetota bacterium]